MRRGEVGSGEGGTAPVIKREHEHEHGGSAGFAAKVVHRRSGSPGQLKQVINVPTGLVLRLLTDDTFPACPRPMNIDPSAKCWLFKEVTMKPKRRPKGADIYVNSGGASGGRLLPIPGSLGNAEGELVSVRRRYGRVSSTAFAGQRWKYHQYTLVRRSAPDEQWVEDLKGIRLYYIQPPEELMTHWTPSSRTLPGMPAHRLLLNPDELGIVHAEMMYHQKIADKTTTKELHDRGGDMKVSDLAPAARAPEPPAMQQHSEGPTGRDLSVRPSSHTVATAGGMVHSLDPDSLTISEAIRMLEDDTFRPGSRPERTGAGRIYKEWHGPNAGGCRRSRNGTLLLQRMGSSQPCLPSPGWGFAPHCFAQGLGVCAAADRWSSSGGRKGATQLLPEDDSKELLPPGTIGMLR